MAGFAELFQERHFPLYGPFLDFWIDEGRRAALESWLRRGIPFDLVGFGYDDLHEMWDGYREGLSALALLVQPPDFFFMANPTGYGLPGWSPPLSASRRRRWRGFPRAA